jgi:L-lactate dehydrogenase complex protein LldF
VVARLPEFEALRDSARDIKNHALAHLDLYLERFEERCAAAGGHVHYAVTAEEARALVLEICRKADAKLVTKGKSMIGEEIAINDFLEENGMTPVETDLGEYLVQIRHELPSHIIMPAIHLTKDQIEADFRRVHTHLAADRQLVEPQTLLTEARTILRDRFLSADVGITGANFLVAETGTSIIVTNEGNGDLTQTLPRVHIVLASIEKVVPTLEDVSQFLRVLARSATAQENVGLHDALDRAAPRERSGRAERISRHHPRQRPHRDARRAVPRDAALHPLRRLHEPLPGLCGGRRPHLRLGLSGPMGAVLTPSLVGIDKAGHLPNASTFCGAARKSARCASRCRT